MEISVISDTITTIATKHGLGLVNFVTDRQNISFSSSDQQQQKPSSAGVLQISAVASPPVKSSNVRTVPKRLARKRSRTKKRSRIDGGGGADDGVDGGGFFGSDGPFGGGAGGGGGGNYDGFSGFNWDESSSYPADPAFDLIYEVLCWIVFSNCLHFAVKKVIRIFADGFADPEREKVPTRFAPLC